MHHLLCVPVGHLVASHVTDVGDIMCLGFHQSLGGGNMVDRSPHRVEIYFSASASSARWVYGDTNLIPINQFISFLFLLICFLAFIR